MKICLITEYFYPEDSGGTPTVLSQLMRYMKDHYKDLEIDVVTSNNLYRSAGGKLPAFVDWNGIKIYRLNSPRSNQPSTIVRLIAGAVFSTMALTKLFSSRKYDLVVVGTNPPSSPIVGRWLWKRFGTPYCYLIHDLYPDIAVGVGALGKNNNIARISRAYQRIWLHDARAVVVLGRCMRDYIITEYHVPTERINVITSWCDPNEIMPMPKETKFREKHGVFGFIVIYAGNLGRSQGLDMVLDAAKLLQKSHPAIQFVLIGKGDAWDNLSSRITDEKIMNVHLLPGVPADEYPEVLASADVSLVSLEPSMEGLAVPSKSYNILSSGRPLVALMSECNEISRMVVEHECGVQVNHGKVQRLVDVIAKLHLNAELGIQMGHNSRTALKENYTIEHTAKKFLNLFNKIVNRN
ncbi:MAG: glycosyltransferase family 4 protein [bacterium]